MKLDQLIEEKRAMREEIRLTENELQQKRQLLEEKDQLSRHKEIDLQRAATNSRSPSPAQRTARASAAEENTSLRNEVAQKDGALIVTHYELHKEKLLRDQLEQKNVKLMERLQKLMTVVETQ